MEYLENVEAIGNKVLVEVQFDEEEYEEIVLEEDTNFDFKTDFSKAIMNAGKIIKKIKLIPSNRCLALKVGSKAHLIEENGIYIFNQFTGIKLIYQDKNYLLLDGDTDFYLKINHIC